MAAELVISQWSVIIVCDYLWHRDERLTNDHHAPKRRRWHVVDHFRLRLVR
jgi:hypothetical protein